MKHNLFSRFISVLLAVVMLAGLMSMPSLADTVTGTDSAATDVQTTDGVDITENDTEVDSALATLSEEGTEGDKEPADNNESSEPTDDAESTGDAETAGDVQEPEESTENTQEPTDTTEGAVDTEDTTEGTEDTENTENTQEPADTNEGTGEGETAGDTQSGSTEQGPAGNNESTEAIQPDSEPQDIDNEATPSESAFDCEAFYDKLMNAQTAEELESLTSGLSDEDMASFQQWLDDDKMTALEEKVAQFTGTDEEDDSQPAPAVNYDKVAPISAATAAAASATGALKARARTFSLTPDTLSDTMDTGTGDTSNLVLEKKAESVDDNTYKITLDAYTEGTVTAGTAPAYDIVLVLDMSTSMKEYTAVSQLDKKETYYVKVTHYWGDEYVEVSYCDTCEAWTDGCKTGWFGHHNPGNIYNPAETQFYSGVTRLDALKQAATTFVNNVAAQEGDNRIAIVGFHNDGVYLSGSDAADSLKDARNEKDSLIRAINGIDNGDLRGATEHGAGLKYAGDVFDSTGNTGRSHLVVMITDGAPAPSGSDAWASRIVKEAIDEAHSLKNDDKAALYTISVMPGSNAEGDSAMDKYMSYVSSNYPNASYTGHWNDDSDWDGDENWIVSQITPGNPADLEDGGSFYLTAGDVETLNSIFGQIGDQIAPPSISLDGSTIIQDTVTKYFDVPAAEAVKVEKIPYDGEQEKFDENNPIDITNDSDIHIEVVDDKVRVTGFNFDENFISKIKKEDQTYGYKLRITFNVTPKAEFWGGNQVPTNVPDDSGIYTIKDSKENLVEKFKETPKVDVPLKKIELTGKELNIYCGNEAPALSEMVDGVNWPTGDESWQVEFVDINYEVNKQINTQEGGSYEIAATLSPKEEGTIKPNEKVLATATLNVFSPTVKWEDTTQVAGSDVDPVQNNYVSTVWKHGTTVSDNVDMFGDKPELAFTFKTANGEDLPDELNGALNVKVTTVTNKGTDITKYTNFEWKENKEESTGCLNCADPNPQYQFRIHDTSNEYPVRFYLQDIEPQTQDYAYTDAWAKLNSWLQGGYANITTAAKPRTSFDSLKTEQGYDPTVTGGMLVDGVSTGGIKGHDNVVTWLSEYNVQPDIDMDKIVEVLQKLQALYPNIGNANVAAAGGTDYNIDYVINHSDQFQIVYTQVTQNLDQILEYYRGNGSVAAGQYSYHVHLSIKYKPGDLTVTKTFEGIDALPADFNITIKDSADNLVQTLTVNNATPKDPENKTYTWNLEDLDEDTYTVTESGYEVSKKDLKAEITVTDYSDETEPNSDTTSATVKVENERVSTVAITNTYKDAAGDLEIVKNLNGMNALKGETASFIFKITCVETQKVYYQTLTFTSAGDEITGKLEKLPAGNYKVEELDVSGYTGTCDDAQDSDGEIVTPDNGNKSATVYVSADGIAKVTFTNAPDGNTPGGNSFAYNQFTYGEDGQWRWNRNDGVAPGNNGAESSEPSTN